MQIYPLNTFSEVQLWHFAEGFSHYFHLRGNSSDYPEGTFQEVWAIGAKQIFRADRDALRCLRNLPPCRLFGFIAYDLKNEVENLASENPDLTHFERLFFFEPQIIVRRDATHWFIEAEDHEAVSVKISAQIDTMPEIRQNDFALTDNLSKKDYIEKVKKIQKHIEEGDIYEINFCTFIAGENAEICPFAAFLKLYELSPMPFSSFVKIENRYAFGASPERFLAKRGNRMISQPIKGTARRGKTDDEDNFLKKQLAESEKEIAENMMITDLVRNDLAKSALTGTTKVEELFGIYTFRHLHQMITTVTCQLRQEVHWSEALTNAFPPGSMTGAPKIKAMQLIDEFEDAKRNLFSGAIGWTDENGDFDFNVVIRHIFYDAESKKLCAWAGSAVTYEALPENEYEECLLKLSLIKSVLS